jgi:ELWxxDGT repeat protein
MGTPELVRDIGTPDDDEPQSFMDAAEFVQAGSRLFFRAWDWRHGWDLWVTDGTGAGPRLVWDLGEGPMSYGPYQLTAMGDLLFFTAPDELTGAYRLWRTDGTPEGTRLVSPDGPFASGELPYVAMNGALYFTGGDGSEAGLWKTDGTAAGTVRVKDLDPAGPSNAQDLQVVNGVLYFLGTDEAHGTELWKSDGTEAGTALVTDLTLGSDSSSFGERMGVGGTLFFTLRTDAAGTEPSPPTMAPRAGSCGRATGQRPAPCA